MKGTSPPVAAPAFENRWPLGTQVAYGEDMSDAWHKGKKLELIKQNSCINLPYIIDGDFVTTQSNTCLMYMGRKTVLMSSSLSDTCNPSRMHQTCLGPCGRHVRTRRTRVDRYVDTPLLLRNVGCAVNIVCLVLMFGRKSHPDSIPAFRAWTKMSTSCTTT